MPRWPDRTPEERAAAKRATSRRSSAKYLARLAIGFMVIDGIELHDVNTPEFLVAQKLLDPGATGDRKAIAAAISELLQLLTNAPSVTIEPI